MHDMETVVIVAISVLSVIFLGSLVVIILVCRHRFCRQFDLSADVLVDAKPDIQLIRETADFELDDVRLRPDIERLLADDQWIDDATGLIPHCLAILKKCRHLTESLVAMTMRNVSKYSQQQLHEIIDIARKIGPRIDDVVQSMYPPLDARLLEARSVALILSVTHLALVTRTICQIHSAIDWIEDALTDMEKHVQILREAGLAMEMFNRNQANCSSLEQLQSSSA